MTKTVLITGAARGIGKSTALLFASHGYHVGVYDVDKEAMAWADGNPSFTKGFLDVRDPQSWETALEEFTSAHNGRLDILVNNAGVLYGGSFVNFTDADDSRLIDINVKGVLYGARAAYPYLKKTRGAQMVNMSSSSSIYGTPKLATYSTTKFAVRGFTEALDVEWQKDDIRVFCVMPLFVGTGMLNDMPKKATQRLGAKLGPDDVAKTIVSACIKRPRFFPKVHYPVGIQEKLMWNVMHFLPSPNFVVRAINRAVTNYDE